MGIDLIARSVRGVEYLVADEIAGLSPTRMTLHPREVRFRLAAPIARLTGLSTPDDVFVSVGPVHQVGHRKDAVPALARRAAELDWDAAIGAVAELRELPGRRRFDVVASLLGRRNYSRYDVEDAVGPVLAGPLRGRYVSRRGGPPDSAVHLTVRVFVDAETAGFAVRLGDAPLHRRRYKQDASRGTLHPPMAAMLARLVAVGHGDTVLDPFCGDGTIPIEAARLAPEADVRGSDYDPVRVTNAAANARRAGVAVAVSVADAGGPDIDDGSVAALLTNPPWNVGVDAEGMLADGLDPFWQQVSRVLSPAGRLGVIMDAQFATADQLRDRGYRISLAQRVRLAGRLSQIVVCAPPGRPVWRLPAGIRHWRRRAIDAGLVTDTAFESKPDAGTGRPA